MNTGKKLLTIVATTSILFSLLTAHVTAVSAEKSQQILAEKARIESKFSQPHREGIFYVKFKDGVTQERIGSINGDFNADGIFPKHTRHTNLQMVRTSSDKESKEKMLEFAINPDVAWVDIPVEGTFSWTDNGDTTTPDDWNASRHWYYEKTNLPEVWDDQNCATGGTNCGGSDEVIVAVLDSGVAYESYAADYEYTDYWTGDSTDYNITYDVAPELNGINLWENPGELGTGNNDDDDNGICDDEHGVDFGIWSENQYSNDTWSCATSTDSQKEGHPNDDYGHGTFVTGIIASLTDNASGSVSSAPNVQIMPMKISYPFEGPLSDLFYYSVAYAVDNGADIIQVSSGWPADYPLLSDAVDYAHQNNVPIIASAGNRDFGDYVLYPAAYETVIAVGAVNADDSRSYYSSWGPEIDLVAPVGESGGSGTATWQETYTCGAGGCDDTDDFTSFSTMYKVGTSFASPQVSAAAAILKSQHSDLSASEIKNMLNATAVDINTKDYDEATGFGLLNVEALLQQPPARNGQNWREDAGNDGDTFVVGDFSGDGRDDVAIFREINPTTIKVWVTNSKGTAFTYSHTWREDIGNAGDTFYSGDFNGDGKDDIAVFREITPTTIKVWVAYSKGTYFDISRTWKDDIGNSGDQFFIGDYNNDNHDDVAIFRTLNPTTVKVWVSRSKASYFDYSQTWRDDIGNQSDVFYSGDFSGANGDDIMIVRTIDPTTVRVWVAKSKISYFDYSHRWKEDVGNDGDIQLVGDYNNDGRVDLLNHRPIGNNTIKRYVLLSNGSSFGYAQYLYNEFYDPAIDTMHIGTFTWGEGAAVLTQRNQNPTTQPLYVSN